MWLYDHASVDRYDLSFANPIWWRPLRRPRTEASARREGRRKTRVDPDRPVTEGWAKSHATSTATATAFIAILPTRSTARIAPAWARRARLSRTGRHWRARAFAHPTKSRLLRGGGEEAGQQHQECCRNPNEIVGDNRDHGLTHTHTNTRGSPRGSAGICCSAQRHGSRTRRFVPAQGKGMWNEQRSNLSAILRLNRSAHSPD